MKHLPSKIILALMVCAPAWVQAAPHEKFALNGVFTQAMFHTNDNNYYGHTDDDVSFDYTQALFNVSWKVLPKLRLAGQAIYQDLGDLKEEELDADYLFADYQFMSSSNATLGLRLGRYKNPYGLYLETSDIIFTRPSILLPQSVYTQTARDTLISSDGLLFYSDIFTDKGTYSIHLAKGIPRVDEVPVLPGITSEFQGEFSNERLTAAGVFFESATGDWRMGLSGIYGEAGYKIKTDSAPDSLAYLMGSQLGIPVSQVEALRSQLVISDIDSDFKVTEIVFSSQYVYNRWTFTGEYAWLNVDIQFKPIHYSTVPSSPIQISGDFSTGVNTWGYGYYLQVENKLSDSITGFLRWDSLVIDRNDKDGSKAAETTGATAYDRFGDSVSTGARFQVSKNILLNAELHYIEGINWLPYTETPNRQQASKYWTLLAFALSFRF